MFNRTCFTYFIEFLSLRSILNLIIFDLKVYLLKRINDDHYDNTLVFRTYIVNDIEVFLV